MSEPGPGDAPAPSALARAGAALRTLRDARLLDPRWLASLQRGGLRWGLGMGAALAAGAYRRGTQPAVVDERGSTSFRSLYERTQRIAEALRGAAGVRAGSRIGVLCRNHRGFVEASLAPQLIGADLVLLHTGFGAPALADVARRERIDWIICDEEFQPLVREAAPKLGCWTAWREAPDALSDLDQIARERRRGLGLLPPRRAGRTIVLTSGTTGTPKGAQRFASPLLGGTAEMIAVARALSLKAVDTIVLAAPAFHSWGRLHLVTAILLQSTVILARRFDPEATLRAIAAHRARTLVAIPVMLQRILDLPRERIECHDTRSLECVLVSGSALPGALAQRWMDRFGDNLYNLYGSTEAACASIASPQDLRAAPDTAGRPPEGTTIAILDENGASLPPGRTGRIFVGNHSLFSGYTGGGDRERIDGRVSTGDLGHFDTAGRLFVDGREDDMIVSGGENVFPGEVEDCLAQHSDVADVCVLGVPDPELGQALAAFVVAAPQATATDDDLRRHIRERLARHKVPRRIERVAALPRNESGKLLRRVLRQTLGGSA